MKRSVSDRPRVLNDVWQPVLEEIYGQRSRPRASYSDYVEAVVRFLDATGQLSRYAAPGLDPLAAIQRHNEDAGQV